jgi:hypothetical protein
LYNTSSVGLDLTLYASVNRSLSLFAVGRVVGQALDTISVAITGDEELVDLEIVVLL